MKPEAWDSIFWLIKVIYGSYLVGLIATAIIKQLL
jgi:hypothetical protein